MPPWNGQWSVYNWCGVGQYPTITATVTDATGSLSRCDAFRCSGDPWP